MKKSFLNHSNPLFTVMLQCETPEVAIGRIRNANSLGADAYGLQIESLKPEYHDPEVYKRIFAEMCGRPSYVTYYRGGKNKGKTDDELAKGLVAIAKSGATLVDVMGDMFCKHPEELTDDKDAIQKVNSASRIAFDIARTMKFKGEYSSKQLKHIEKAIEALK